MSTESTDIFMTNGRTYRAINDDLSRMIKKAYGYTKGTVCATRYVYKHGKLSEWRIYIYWHEEGRYMSKCLGLLEDVLPKADLFSGRNLNAQETS